MPCFFLCYVFLVKCLGTDLDLIKKVSSYDVLKCAAVMCILPFKENMMLAFKNAMSGEVQIQPDLTFFSQLLNIMENNNF